MIKQYRYWFEYVRAPPEIQKKIGTMNEAFGYTTKRQDELGNPLVSEMFLMHCKAVSVSIKNNF